MQDEKEKRIKVAVRCRPLHPVKERYDRKCVQRTDENALVVAMTEADGADETGEKAKKETLNFSFDFFFDETQPQVEIYNEAVLEIVDATLDGHNSTVLAYGQTGTGKTYTTLGVVDDKGASLLGPQSGIFLRVLTDLFLYKDRCAASVHVAVLLSIVEVYNEEVRDLLQKKKVMTVREIGDDVHMPELAQESVVDLSGVYTFFKIADSCRSVTATKMNDASSRSHAIFIIDLIQQAKTPANPDPPTAQDIQKCLAGDASVCKGVNPITRSRTCIVDLAGSERIKRSGVSGKGLEEAKKINTSLSALGKVIQGLYEGHKHISYRDTRLTRILRSCFSDPNCKIVLCANISPTVKSFSETKSTLRFANQVKGIKATQVSIDPEAEIAYLEKFRRLEEVAGDLRIAALTHDFVLQQPSCLCVEEATDEPTKKALIAHIAEQYKSGVVKRMREREEAEEREVGRLVKEMTESKLRTMAEERKRIEDSIQAEQKAEKTLAAELVRTKAGKEEEVKQKTEESQRLRQSRWAVEEKLVKLDQLVAELRDELRAAESATIGGGGGADDAEVRHVVTQEAERRAAAEEYHRKTADFAGRLLQLRGLQADHIHARQALLPGSDRRHALEAVAHKGQTSVPFCEGIARWIADRALRVAAGKAKAGDGETCEHLTKQLPYEHFPSGAALTTGACPMADEPPGSAVAAEPCAEDYDDCDGDGIASEQQAREDAAAMVGTDAAQVTAALPPPAAAGLAGVGAAGPDGGARPFRFDLRQARDGPDPRRRAAEDEAARRQQAALQMKLLAYKGMNKRVGRMGLDPPDAADRVYLSTIYDAYGVSSGCSVEGDVVRWLLHGQHLVKHGRKGPPRRRLFWVSGCKTQLCWVDDTRLQARRRSVALKDVVGIALGQGSRVFQKTCGRPSPGNPGFHESFSVVLSSPADAAGTLVTLDLVAGNVESFEAWVLGLAALTGCQPQWGAAAAARDERVVDDARKVVSQRLAQVQDHQDQCMGDMLRVFEQMGGPHVPHVREGATGTALYLTKGELRHMLPCGVDIFRVQEAWKALEVEGLVFDPHQVDLRWPRASQLPAA